MFSTIKNWFKSYKLKKEIYNNLHSFLTSPACPEQYDICFGEKKRDSIFAGYLHLRNGIVTICFSNTGTIESIDTYNCIALYSKVIGNKNIQMFNSKKQRDFYLKKAKKLITNIIFADLNSTNLI